jgi:hypothetical protein
MKLRDNHTGQVTRLLAYDADLDVDPKDARFRYATGATALRWADLDENASLALMEDLLKVGLYPKTTN